MKEVTNGLNYQSFKHQLGESLRNIHVITYEQSQNANLTLLISKMSEALNPNKSYNHIGEGGTLDELLKKQSGIRFVINAGFSHYRKDFYVWSHQDFNIGDPVGIVKIRDHFFDDCIHYNHYGFLVQEDKESRWKITKFDHLNKKSKYILGCTPLLIFNSESLTIPNTDMMPVIPPNINPPSFLGHGLQNHPRTAVGMKGDTLYFINVENNPEDTGGCTLIQLQQLGKFLQLDSLLNLDGGGSSQFKLIDNNNIITNYIKPIDSNRVLGHVLILFDELLK